MDNRKSYEYTKLISDKDAKTHGGIKIVVSIYNTEVIGHQ